MLNRKYLLAAALTSASLAALSMPTAAWAQDADPNATPECQEAIFDATSGTGVAGTTVPDALQCGVGAKLTRRLTNVTAGIGDSDAANLGQVKTLIADAGIVGGAVDLTPLNTSVAALGDKVGVQGTDIANLKTTVGKQGTDIADLKTAVANLGTGTGGTGGAGGS